MRENSYGLTGSYFCTPSVFRRCPVRKRSMSSQVFIAAMNPAVAFCVATVFIALSRRLPDRTYLFTLSVGFIYLGLGFIAHDFRLLTPPGGINYAANALIMISVGLACASVLIRANIRVPLVAFGLVAAATTTSFMWWSWGTPSMVGRIIAVSVGFVGFATIALFLILRSGIATLSDRLIALGLAVSLSVAVARPVLVLQGVLSINAGGDFRDSTYWETVRAFSPIMAMAVAGLFLLGIVSDLMDRMRVEAETDYLTGLLNRRGFEQAATSALAQSTAAAQPAVLLADIDDFKKINDAFGHDVGDRVISAVAQVLETHGGANIAGRVGGEEFALFFPGTALGQLRQSADAIREALASIPVTGLPGDYPLTVSMGLHLHDGAETLREMYAGADKALYRAKHEGKNRAVHSPARLGVVAVADHSLSA